MKVVHKDLQALGVDHESVKKFLKYKEADDKVGDDPYMSSAAEKTARTKAYRQMHKDLTAKTKNPNVAINAMHKIYDYEGKDSMYESMMSFKSFIEEAKDPCWKGYKQLGMKDKNGKKVPNCIPVSEDDDEKKDYVDTDEYKTDKQGRKYHPHKIKLESVDEQFDVIEEMVMALAEEHNIDPEIIWEDFESVDDEELLEYAVDSKGYKSSTGGLTQKGRDAYNAKGGNLQAPVTTPPSKLKPGSKAANRRKSFCARMGGMEGAMKKPNGEPTRKALALRKWNC